MDPDTISFAELRGGIIVVRVVGRGSYANSVEFKRLADHMVSRYGPGNYHFVIDLENCATMDSTFMGVLASIGLRQKRDDTERLTVVNANEQNLRLLQTLGLSHFMNVRPMGKSEQLNVKNGAFQVAERQELSKTDRIVHMIEAHENLTDADAENAVRFESVLKYLHESLDREKHD